jgi:hypothetical protein
MSRVIAVTVTLVTAATATMVAAATVVPAMAAPRPTTARHAAHATIADSMANEIGEVEGGKYVTVVHCQGVDAPPPIQLAKGNRLLAVNGAPLSAAVAGALNKPGAYKTVYTCTVVLKEDAPPTPKAASKNCKIVTGHGIRTGAGADCAKPDTRKRCELVTGRGTRTGAGAGCRKTVTLNTGFGGMASRVKDHRPAN